MVTIFSRFKKIPCLQDRQTKKYLSFSSIVRVHSPFEWYTEVRILKNLQLLQLVFYRWENNLYMLFNANLKKSRQILFNVCWIFQFKYVLFRFKIIFPNRKFLIVWPRYVHLNCFVVMYNRNVTEAHVLSSAKFLWYFLLSSQQQSRHKIFALAFLKSNSTTIFHN